MYLLIDQVGIHLQTNSPEIETSCRALFGSWLRDSLHTETIIATLTMSLEDEPIALPMQDPFFVDNRVFNIETKEGLLTAYHLQSGHTHLHFPDGATGILPPTENGAVPLQIQGTITPRFLAREILDDFITLCISPILRRYGYFMVHSAGATYNGQGILLVGGTHSGKTTTCLNLIFNGWKLLANDIIVLHQREDGIYALPMPDMLMVRPKTFELLPKFAAHIETIDVQYVGTTAMIPSADIVNNQWSEPCKVTTIAFPSVEKRPRSETVQLPKSIALAFLSQESLDCWDTETFELHITFLQQLVQQITPYQLQLGTDIDKLPQKLQSILVF